jgi:hypothetical protein
MYQAPAAPLSIGGVLDNGFQLLKASFGKVIGLAFVSAIIGSAPNLLLPQPPLTDEPQIATGLLAGSLIAGLISVLFYGAIIARIDAVIKGSEMSFMESVQIGAKRLLPMILCFIIYGVAVLVGLLLLVVPGMILALSLGMAPYLVITENRGPVDAIKHSHNLVWGNWWRTAIILTVIMFILFSVYFLVGMISGVSVFAGSAELNEAGLLFNLIMALLSAVITPVGYAMGMALLTDLQLRKEGSDLEDRIEAIT